MIAILITFLFLLESTTRLFDLSAHTVPEFIIESNKLLKPGTKDVWIRGGLGEIRSNYSVNNQGFNSLLDYSELDSTKINIAIIGDSYIEGFHSDVQNSIGRYLERLTNGKTEVHEYGRSGGNIHDFELMYDQFVKKKYDVTFILMTSKDLMTEQPSFMNFNGSLPDKSLMRLFYNNLSFLRYLNINQKFKEKLNRIFFTTTPEKAIYTKSNKKISSDFINKFDESVVFIFEAGKMDSILIQTYPERFLKIEHKKFPYTHGFDGHWNDIGRMNCAYSLKNYLNL